MSGETGNLYGHCETCGSALTLRAADLGTTITSTVYQTYCLWCRQPRRPAGSSASGRS